ncbi:MAG TPA: PAS domain S-box protein [Actinomycetota bacterium]|nr:PAS domain S-box protein [Actinomycetota bacterium]
MALDGATLDPYRLRSVRVGIQASLMVLVALVMFRVLPGGDEISAGTFVTIWTLTAVATVIALILPWPSLVESGAAMRVLYAWSVADIILITMAIAAAGASSPTFFMFYALTTIFFAASYPFKSQVGLFAFTCICYLAATSVTNPPVSMADQFLRLVVLGVVAFMASFMSRELMRQMALHKHAHSGLEREFEDLQKADELFRAVSELASDYVYSMTVRPDSSLEWEWVSGGFDRVTGFTPEEFEQRGGWTALLHPDDLEPATNAFEKVLAGERRVDSWQIVTKTGEVRCVRVYVAPVWNDEANRVVRVFGAVQDITDSKRHEEALVQTNSLLHATLESTADGVLVVNREGKIVAFNQKFVNMWRIPPDVISSRDDERALEAVLDQLRDPAAFLQKVHALYERPTESSSDILEFKDGRVIERYSNPQWVGGEVVGRVWSFRDVTEQQFSHSKIHDALNALQRADGERRRLLTHLVKAKEEERSRVAADIHDDSVQIMTSVAIEIERLSRRTADPETKEKLSLLEESVRAAIGSLRATVFELKPPTLAQEGLGSALCLYLEEFQLDTGVRYEFNNQLDGEPSQELRVALYRIAQEALVNIRKHAHANHVCIDLIPDEPGIRLRVTDDGVGFDANRLKGGPSFRGHIGLTEMRERAEMLGGNLRIRSAKPSGTVIDVWIPNANAAPMADVDERASA